MVNKIVKMRGKQSMAFALALSLVACSMVTVSTKQEVNAAVHKNLTKAKVPAKRVLKAGEKATIKVTKVPAETKIDYCSSNKKIAKVTQKGIVTALKKGTCTIKVKLSYRKKKITKNCKITVTKQSVEAIQNVSPNPTSVVKETKQPDTVSQNAVMATKQPTVTVKPTVSPVTSAPADQSTQQPIVGSQEPMHTDAPTQTSGFENREKTTATKNFSYSADMQDPIVWMKKETVDGVQYYQYTLPMSEFRAYANDDSKQTFTYMKQKCEEDGALIGEPESMIAPISGFMTLNVDMDDISCNVSIISVNQKTGTLLVTAKNTSVVSLEFR